MSDDILANLTAAFAQIKQAREEAPVYVFATREEAEMFRTRARWDLIVDDEHVIVSPVAMPGQVLVMRTAPHPFIEVAP